MIFHNTNSIHLKPFFMLINGLPMRSAGFHSTSVSNYYKFLSLAFTFNFTPKPALNIAFVGTRI